MKDSLRLLAVEGVRRLPVVDKQGHVVGVVTQETATLVSPGGVSTLTVATAEFRGRSLEVKTTDVPIADVAASGKSRLSFEKTGTGIVYYTARLQSAPRELPATALDRGVIVRVARRDRVHAGERPAPDELRTGAVFTEPIDVTRIRYPREEVGHVWRACVRHDCRERAIRSPHDAIHLDVLQHLRRAGQ